MIFAISSLQVPSHHLPQFYSHFSSPSPSHSSLFLGTSHPYPDDTFYSVGRVPRKLLLKYLGIKMYLVRLKNPPAPKVDYGIANAIGNIALTLGRPATLPSAGICSPHARRAERTQ
jgi:hypothetical protein